MRLQPLRMKYIRTSSGRWTLARCFGSVLEDKIKDDFTTAPYLYTQTGEFCVAYQRAVDDFQRTNN